MLGGIVDPELAERLPGRHDVALGPVRLTLEVELAELHDHDAVVGQVIQGLLDHLDGVEVALRQDERPRRGGVVGGIAVRRHVPHEVVAVRAAGQERTTVGLVDRDVRNLVEMPGEVGVLVLEQADGHRVELDALDLLAAEVQRRQDLVAAGRPDDQGVVVVATEQAEGDGAGLRLVALERRRVAVVLVDAGTVRTVVRQDLRVGGRPDDVDTEDRTPLTELRCHLGLRRLGRDVGERPVRDHDDQERDGDRAGETARDRPDPLARHEPGKREHQGGEHHHRRWPERADERDGHDAAEAGADEVGEVERSHAFGRATQDHRDDHAQRDERGEQHEADEPEDRQVLERRGRAVVPDLHRVDRDLGHDEIADGHADRSRQAAHRQDPLGRCVTQPLRHRDEHTTRADAEECQPQHQVGVVVPELVGDDAGVADLQQQPREADEEDDSELSLAAASRSRHVGKRSGGGGQPAYRCWASRISLRAESAPSQRPISDSLPGSSAL